MHFEMIPAYDHPQEIRQLFQEYTDLLADGDPTFREYLKIQNYDKEIAHLEDKYGPPDGRLYLAVVDGAAAGCIALRRMDSCRCEMKRLYVRPQYQGHGIGRQLTEQILQDARSIGYHWVYLDSFPFLDRAIAMYRHMGFREIEKYNDSPMTSAVYMALEL